MKEYNLIIEVLDGHSPLQGWGTVNGKRFFFRARWDRWCFCLSEDPDLDPIDIFSSEQGFYLEGFYGNGPYDASYMPNEDGEKIINECCRKYILEKLKIVEK